MSNTLNSELTIETLLAAFAAAKKAFDENYPPDAPKYELWLRAPYQKGEVMITCGDGPDLKTRVRAGLTAREPGSAVP